MNKRTWNKTNGYFASSWCDVLWSCQCIVQMYFAESKVCLLHLVCIPEVSIFFVCQCLPHFGLFIFFLLLDLVDAPPVILPYIIHEETESSQQTCWTRRQDSDFGRAILGCVFALEGLGSYNVTEREGCTHGRTSKCSFGWPSNIGNRPLNSVNKSQSKLSCKYETYPKVYRHGSHDGIDKVNSCEDTCAVGDGHKWHERSTNNSTITMLVVSSNDSREWWHTPEWYRKKSTWSGMIFAVYHSPQEG